MHLNPTSFQEDTSCLKIVINDLSSLSSSGRFGRWYDDDIRDINFQTCSSNIIIE